MDPILSLEEALIQYNNNRRSSSLRGNHEHQVVILLRTLSMEDRADISKLMNTILSARIEGYQPVNAIYRSALNRLFPNLIFLNYRNAKIKKMIKQLKKLHTHGHMTASIADQISKHSIIDPAGFISGLLEMHRKRIMDNRSLEVMLINTQDHSILAKSLIAIHQSELWGDQILKFVNIPSELTNGLSKAIIKLKQDRLLTRSTLNMLFEKDLYQHEVLAEALMKLHKVGLLEENLNRIRLSGKINFISVNINSIEQNLLSQEILDKLLSYNKGQWLTFSEAVVLLEHHKLWSSENFNLLYHHNDIKEIYKILFEMSELDLSMPQDAFSLVLKNNHPRELAHVFIWLRYKGSLSRSFKESLAASSNIRILNDVMDLMEENHLLTMENGVKIIQYPLLWSQEAQDSIWPLLKEQFVTQNVFNKVLGIAKSNTDSNTIFSKIIEFTKSLQTSGSQNIHTVAIEDSVAESIQYLYNHYKKEVRGEKLSEKLGEIKDWIKSLPDDIKNRSANRFIDNITSNNYVNYIDAASSISLKQVVALFYVAIHNENEREGSLEDAKKIFIEGLYEIQRGGNLNDRWEDNNRPDSPICISGAANKLI